MTKVKLGATGDRDDHTWSTANTVRAVTRYRHRHDFTTVRDTPTKETREETPNTTRMCITNSLVCSLVVFSCYDQMVMSVVTNRTFDWVDLTRPNLMTERGHATRRMGSHHSQVMRIHLLVSLVRLADTMSASRVDDLPGRSDTT